MIVKTIAESENYFRNPRNLSSPPYRMRHDECFKFYTATSNQIKRFLIMSVSMVKIIFHKSVIIFFQPELTFSDNFLTWGFSGTD